MQFDWDANKARSNYVKHGVTFEEATTVFDNSLTLLFDDPDHSKAEFREIALGESLSARVLVISFTKRGENVLRIISARPASRKERAYYEQQFKNDVGE